MDSLKKQTDGFSFVKISALTGEGLRTSSRRFEI